MSGRDPRQGNQSAHIVIRRLPYLHCRLHRPSHHRGRVDHQIVPQSPAILQMIGSVFRDGLEWQSVGRTWRVLYTIVWVFHHDTAEEDTLGDRILGEPLPYRRFLFTGRKRHRLLSRGSEKSHYGRGYETSGGGRRVSRAKRKERWWLGKEGRKEQFQLVKSRIKASLSLVNFNLSWELI